MAQMVMMVGGEVALADGQKWVPKALTVLWVAAARQHQWQGGGSDDFGGEELTGGGGSVLRWCPEKMEGSMVKMMTRGSQREARVGQR